MTRRTLMLLLVVPVLGAALGRVAGPFFARANRTVQLAACVSMEERENLKERALESEAFRATGQPVGKLVEEARRVVQRFKIGTVFFGAWCGLVIALKLIVLSNTHPQRIYEADSAACLACGRCYLSCPRERLRLGEVVGGGSVSAASCSTD